MRGAMKVSFENRGSEATSWLLSSGPGGTDGGGMLVEDMLIESEHLRL